MAGNATVTLYKNGVFTTYEIWLTAISTASQNEFMTQQVHNGIQWIPIRRAEMMFNFTAVWPLVGTLARKSGPQLGFEDIDPADGFAKMNKFQDAIRDHQRAIVQGDTNQWMHVNYHNNSDASSPIFNKLISQQPLEPMVYDGIIQIAEKQYVRFQNLFFTNYNMTIQNKNTANTPDTFVTAADGKNAINYAPTTSDQQRYGDGWLDVNALALGSDRAVRLIQGIPG